MLAIKLLSFCTGLDRIHEGMADVLRLNAPFFKKLLLKGKDDADDEKSGGHRDGNIADEVAPDGPA